MALRQRRTGKADVDLSTWDAAVFSKMYAFQIRGRTLLFALPLTLGTRSIAKRHYSSLHSVCFGNVGALQCQVSASMITQSLQAVNAMAFSMLEKQEQRIFKVAAESLQLHCNYGIRGRLGKLGRGCQISERSQGMSSDGVFFFSDCR